MTLFCSDVYVAYIARRAYHFIEILPIALFLRVTEIKVHCAATNFLMHCLLYRSGNSSPNLISNRGLRSTPPSIHSLPEGFE